MAKRQVQEYAQEADRLEGFPAPRETTDLIGHGDALARVARAIRKGRPPQAWLIAGPPGIGKATFAYRIARAMLRYGASADAVADLAMPPNDPVSLQVAAGAHPGLLALRRVVNPKTGKLMTVLSVDEVRRLSGFFGLTSGAGGWRVAIVDTADEMSDNAANAVLKILEEPPQRGMLILLSNRPGRLLPTIRSRCQRIDLRSLSDAEVETALEKYAPDVKPKERASIVALAEGSIGMALASTSGEGVARAKDAAAMICNAESVDVSALFAQGDRLARGASGLDDFAAALNQALVARVRDRAGRGERKVLLPWTEATEEAMRRFARTSALHMEPRQTLLSTARLLHNARRRGGAL